jgi:hypothetical protein
MEEGTELLARLRANKGVPGRGVRAGAHHAAPPLPMFTSCCPGWVPLGWGAAASLGMRKGDKGTGVKTTGMLHPRPRAPAHAAALKCPSWVNLVEQEYPQLTPPNHPPPPTPRHPHIKSAQLGQPGGAGVSGVHPPPQLMQEPDAGREGGGGRGGWGAMGAV